MRSGVFEDGEFEIVEAGGIGDHVDLGDLAAGEGEAEDAEEAAARREHQADGAIDQGRAGEFGAASKGDGLTSPNLGAADLDGRTGRQSASVGGHCELGVEDGDESVKISGAQGGEEGIDGFALPGQMGGGSGGCSAHPAAGPAGELAGGSRGTADDGADLVEGEIKGVVENEGKAFCGIEAVKDNEEGQTDGVGEEGFLFGVGTRLAGRGGFGRGIGRVGRRRGGRGFEGLLAAGLAGAQHIKADARYDGCKPGAEILDAFGAGTAEAEPGFLDSVVGFSQRARHAVGDGAQMAAVFFEAVSQP